MYKLYLDNVKNIIDTNLNDNILNHINKYKNDDRRKESYLAYSLLKKGLSEIGIYDFDIDFKSKPKIIGHNIYFNLSHDESYSCAVISDNIIGVDLMHIRKLDLKLANYILNEHENMPQNDFEYTILGCKKEAYIKYIGSSISSDMKNINTNNFLYEVLDYNGFIVVICLGSK